MDDKLFFSYYLPALHTALKQDNGKNIPDPEQYISDQYLVKQISQYIDQTTDDVF